jgi:tetratricopeptide (TPR) repeat protein
MLRTTPEPEATTAYLEAVAVLGFTPAWSGSRQRMEVLLGRLIEVGADSMAHDAMVRGWIGFLRGFFVYLVEPRPWQAFLLAEQARQDFREIGSERNVGSVQSVIGAALCALGDLPGALASLREAIVATRRTGQHLAVAHAQRLLIETLAGSPEPEHRREAHALLREWMGSGDSHPFKQGTAQAVLAKVVAANGELREAEAYARAACELLAPFPSHLIYARMVLSDVLRAQGSAAEARRVAALGVQELERMGSEGMHAVAMHLTLAEACFAEGDANAGEAALGKALRCVRERASDILDAAVRERFLRQVPENARTLELSRQRWGESAA